MRKINTRNFRVATRSTVHEINQKIVLNLIREHHPISRAELARRMNVRRAALTQIVRELLDSKEVVETGTAVAARGRRPTLLRIRTSGRLATAVDVRPTLTSLVLADFAGTVLGREAFPTPSRPDDFTRELGARVNKLLASDPAAMTTATCHGIGVVVPGMVDRRSGRVLYAPRLGWRDVDFRDVLAEHVSIPVFVESAPIACALARLWSPPGESRAVNNFAYVSVSDGVGVGIVVSGEVLRGEAHTAGEFGHVSLDPLGPVCACGKRGCWEA
ncbi:MAG TPA: ROK family protein, partial [Gemmatimonadaceae bacterium]|nr:ROK family protein [Gemmatimonadaceae bacterium]